MTKDNLRPPSNQQSADSDVQRASTWDERWLPVAATYWVEICGGFLLIFGLLNLIGLPSTASNGLLTYSVEFVRQWFGWGAYVVFLAVSLSGAYLLLRRVRGFTRSLVPVQSLVAFALLLLMALALTHVLTGATLEVAQAGRAGGLIGWMLAAPPLQILGPVVTLIIYLLVLGVVVYMLSGRTLDDLIRSLVFASGRLRRWSEELAANPDDEPVRTVANYSEPVEPLVNTLDAEPKPAHLRVNTGPSRFRPKYDQPATTTPQAAPDTSLPEFPPLDLLTAGERLGITPAQINHSARIIEQTLRDFGLDGEVTDIRSGPALTQFGVEPGYIVRTDNRGQIVKSQKVRVSQIANLRKDLALALAVPRLRIEAPVPGRGIVGIEVPNPNASMVRLRDGMDSAEFAALRKKPLAVALGENVAGQSIAINLAKMPHLLIAGTTGSGKSVCMKALITSLIMHNSPETLRLVMIDPKRVEMIRFNGLPHLYGPAEVEGERIIGVLRWVVAEMERRYALFADINARQLSSYNAKMRDQGRSGLPHMVVFIDELADLMVQYSAETERLLCRLAQMSRATGIHLVVATQRPSTDVITGLIKANFPARIAFAVASSTDSRVVLDTTGAEQLLGNGDMLFLNSDAAVPTRVQGCFVDDDEIDHIVEFWQQKYPDADETPPPWQSLLERMKVIEDTDDEIEAAIALCQKYDNISTSLIQRRLRVGFPRAARIMETLYEMGLVEDPKRGGKTRKTYVSKQDADPLGDFIADQKPDI